MKRIAILCVLVGSVSVSYGQTLTTDRNTVIAAGGQHVDLPGVSGSIHNFLDLSDGNRISFSRPQTRLDVPTDWSTWRPGSQPKLLEDPQGRAVVLTFDQPVSTFGLEMMPVWLFGRFMQMEILQGGVGEITQYTSGTTGALFFGFTEGSVSQLRISRIPLNDFGSNAFGNILYAPVPEPATLIAMSIGTLVFCRRKFRKN